jgi:flagellar basal-body rod protein FlgC
MPMDYSDSFSISAAGMQVERLRVDIASLNLANAGTVAGADGGVYRPARVLVRNAMAAQATQVTHRVHLAHGTFLPADWRPASPAGLQGAGDAFGSRAGSAHAGESGNAVGNTVGHDLDNCSTCAPGDNAAIASTAATAFTAAGIAGPLLPDAGFSGEGNDPLLRLLPRASVERGAAVPRLVHDPASPLADENGFVAVARVDTATEMFNLMSATRAYEANVAAFNAARQMAQRALDIGRPG